MSKGKLSSSHPELSVLIQHASKIEDLGPAVDLEYLPEVAADCQAIDVLIRMVTEEGPARLISEALAYGFLRLRGGALEAWLEVPQVRESINKPVMAFCTEPEVLSAMLPYDPTEEDFISLERVRLLKGAGFDLKSTISYRVDDRKQYSQCTPLMIVALEGSLETLQYLLSLPAEAISLHQKDGEGRSALHYAAERDSEVFFQSVLDAGLKVNATDGGNETILHREEIIRTRESL